MTRRIDRHGVWGLGVERESSPGVYASLVAEIDGWELWQFETANGIYYTAGKAAVGLRMPEPLGYAQSLFTPGLFMHVVVRDELLAFVHGRHAHTVKAEMRIEGARFMHPVPTRFDPLPFDGKRIEFVLRTMPGPQSFTEAVAEQAIIDMTGLNAIVTAHAAL